MENTLQVLDKGPSILAQARLLPRRVLQSAVKRTSCPSAPGFNTWLGSSRVTICGERGEGEGEGASTIRSGAEALGQIMTQLQGILLSCCVRLVTGCRTQTSMGGRMKRSRE